MQANTTSCKTGSIANFYLLYTKVCRTGSKLTFTAVHGVKPLTFKFKLTFTAVHGVKPEVSL